MPAQSGGQACTFGACARQDLVEEMKPHYQDLGHWKTAQQLPVVYHDIYNVKLFGIEKLHPFDSTKFEKVRRSLEKQGLVQRSQLVNAVEATKEMLLDVHTKRYIDELSYGWQKLQEVTEAPCLCLLPNALVQARLHRPMRFHVGGTILAVALALQHGWAINLGGGMHHAHAEDGGGWCIYDDWMLAIRRLRSATGGKVRKALYIDLDVHQGNGIERDKLHFGDPDLFIFDMYNCELWPGDVRARRGIDHEVTITCGCSGHEYLARLGPALEHCFTACKPDIVLYNAGTDILAGDQLGRCLVSAESVVKRDEMVWQAALDNKVPICMALSGGYARDSAAVIARCLANILQTFHLVPPTK